MVRCYSCMGYVDTSVDDYKYLRLMKQDVNTGYVEPVTIVVVCDRCHYNMKQEGMVQ